jgi:hypothetical protein
MTACGVILRRDFSREVASGMRPLQARPKAVSDREQGHLEQSLPINADLASDRTRARLQVP